MVDFAGWQMPMQYSGIIPEHRAVRDHAGLFDVSHMGRILVEGLQAEPFLDFLSTNIIAGKAAYSATYTVLPHQNGGCVDDVIIYKLDQTHFFMIANASNRQKDLNHLIAHSAGFDVTISDRFSEEGILAIQGPASLAIMAPLFPETSSLMHMHFVSTQYRGQEVIISATGYTGAAGFEVYASSGVIVELWKELLARGEKHGLVPIGLGARDTLRLEMGYALYGHELTEDIQPIESVSHWTVKSKQHDFLGKEFQQGKKRSQHGIELLDKGVAREGYDIFKDGKLVGQVTSGTFSPSLQKGIAIIISDQPLNEGDLVEVQIRQNRCSAKVVKLPFLVSSS